MIKIPCTYMCSVNVQCTEIERQMKFKRIKSANTCHAYLQIEITHPYLPLALFSELNRHQYKHCT